MCFKSKTIECLLRLKQQSNHVFIIHEKKNTIKILTIKLLLEMKRIRHMLSNLIFNNLLNYWYIQKTKLIMKLPLRMWRIMSLSQNIFRRCIRISFPRLCWCRYIWESMTSTWNLVNTMWNNYLFVEVKLHIKYKLHC